MVDYGTYSNLVDFDIMLELARFHRLVNEESPELEQFQPRRSGAGPQRDGAGGLDRVHAEQHDAHGAATLRDMRHEAAGAGRRRRRVAAGLWRGGAAHRGGWRDERDGRSQPRKHSVCHCREGRGPDQKWGRLRDGANPGFETFDIYMTLATRTHCLWREHASCLGSARPKW